MNKFDFNEELDSGIDLTPLIDVVFLLIIFFVLATTFSKPVLDVILPITKCAEKVKSNNPDLIVEIDKNGKIFCEKKYYSLNEIEQLIIFKPECRINLFVDENAPFKSFITIIDKAKESGRNNIVVTTNKNDK